MGKPKAKIPLKAHQQQPLSGSSDGNLGTLKQCCLHYSFEGKGHLRRSLLDILASIHDEPCQLCPQESVVTKQDVGSLNNKKKQKHKKKEGSGAAKLKISTWICLTCGGYFCIEAGIKAASHSRMHAMHTDHWWAAKSNDPSSIYCFKCDSEVPLNLSSVVDKEVRTVVPDSRFFIQGFQTLGSVSCFNAILQNFLSLKLLRQKILALEFPRAAHIAIALRDLVARTSDSRILVVLSQEILLSKICSRYPDFRSNRMMDSEESFRCFIDALQTEEKESWAGVYEAIDSTIVDSVFIGHCSIELSCKKCHYHFIRDEEFFYLPLPVLSSNVSIEDCLAQYTDSETWLCEKCANSEGNLGDATKRLLINVPPPVLVLYLKSSHDQSKQTKVRVQYKAHLDIGPFVDPSSRVDGEIVYHLAGAVLHNETMTGGHYIANVRAEKENLKGSALCWFNASDDQVRRTSFELFEGEPHLLFYQKPMAQNMVKEDAKVIAKVKAAQEDSDCKEPAPNHMERHPEVKVETPLPLVLDMVKEDAKVIAKVKAAQEDSDCKEPAPNHMERHPEQVETPLPLVLEMVEGSHVIKGLRNIQYSCFFNVMLQILLALDPLRRKMLGTDVRRGPLAEFLRQFFTDTSASSPARGPLDPEDFFKSVCLVCPGFKIGRMEDSHELLGLFLSYLREEEANARQISMNIPIHKAKTFVNSIFLGRCSSTVTSIQCDHCSSQFDPFLDISLAIPQRSCPVSIEDCWDSYTEPESVQDGWVCPHCTNAQGMPDAKPVRRNSMKKLLIADAPSVLVVTLKRFQYDHSTQVSRKLQDHVNFKELFDMRRFMTKRSVNTTTMYRLVGVVQHSGDLEGGHYIAYVRANKMESQKHTNTDCKSWFYASDETIREVCLDDLLRCEAYILVYEKCLTFQSSGNPTDEERQVADINMQPHSSHSSGNRMGDASLFAGTKMQPQAAASISDSTPLPQDEKCLISESSGNPTDEECQVADIKMQAQTGASIGDSSPLPQDEVHLWEYPRTRNPLKKEINAIATKNGLVGKNVVLFLDRFILQGDKKPFYHCELVTMCERGSGSRELNIHYSHLLQFSKVLAMDVCNGYQRLRQNLKEAAITFAQKLLDKDLNLTSGGRNRMHELASTDPDSSLELKFLEMPQMHEQLTDGLRPPLSQPMHVYGHDWGGYAIRRPFPEKCARVQKLVGYVISNHRDGFSWDGDFTIEDIDLYDDKVFIRKEPKSFPIHPRISQEMICAMQKDFSRIKESVLKEFKCLEGPIPYFHAFSELFGGMESYADWWSKEETAEALRELIEHHPFLKPAMARSHLWSGIFGACRSHDAGDVTALFKDILWSNRSSDSWTTKARQSENRMIKNVIRHKDKVKPEVAAAEPEPAAATAAAAQPAAAPAAAAELAAAEPEAEDGSKMVLYYGDNYELLFEFLRHLCQHGSAYSFQFRPSGEHVNRPRNQLMKSLDEPEVAGSHILEEDMVEALTLLLRHSGMTGLLESVWDCYKSCNYPLRPQRRNH